MTETLPKFKFYQAENSLGGRLPQRSQTLRPGLVIERGDFDRAATSAVFGYFVGGGCAFGVLENSEYRITPAFHDLCRDAAPGTPLGEKQSSMVQFDSSRQTHLALRRGARDMRARTIAA